MDFLTSILSLAASLISLIAVMIGLKLVNEYKSKVQPRLDNEEYIMRLLRDKSGRIKLTELHKADWSENTKLSTVRRFVTRNRKDADKY